jgi:hypothetical protein
MAKIYSSAVQKKEISQLKQEIEQKTGKSTEQLYEEREKRIRDATNLKKPDRVPMFMFPDPAARFHLPQSAAYYDPVAWRQALIEETLYLEPDTAYSGLSTSGDSLTALDVKNKLWPGGTLPPNYEYQFIEGEWMKEDEYDLFLKDSTDFMIRYYLPRVYGALKPLSELPSLNLIMNSFENMVTFFTSPEFKKLARAVNKSAVELEKYRKAFGDLQEDFALLGFPAMSHPGGCGVAPFDVLSSFLRGMKGTMLDMYRQPENVVKACEAILARRVATAKPADPKARGNPKRAFMPLWRGDKNFMSQKQFEKFYWPTLKKTMLADIKLGFTPMPVFEADFGDRLECMLELPKGKAVAVVEHMDVVRAKEILGGHICVSGNVPKSLRYGSVSEMTDYYKKLIKTCGKGGGFMLNIALTNQGTIEEHKAMIETIKEYARY